ncbi:MAG: hypothetical protein M1401_11365 [Chloroflexi bacterium]|nr:hypothetical protein [Chloroflexota bacterium]MCL5109445.1 hypothetical protein [Chloroflexota bacterium]
MAIDAGKVSKNQTAAQRAVAQAVDSGKVCGRCGESIKLRDLLNVRTVDQASGRKGIVSYHRACYGL